MNKTLMNFAHYLFQPFSAPRRAWFALLAAASLVTPAYSLTIVPTFDSSITTDPNGVAMENAINAAIQILQSNLTDSLTVQIHFTNDASVSLGQSLTWGGDYAYADFLTALKSKAADATDTNALSQLTNPSIDPVIGGTQIHLTLAQARNLGLNTGYGPDGFDSTISLNMPLMNFTRPGLISTNYDLQSTVEHEMDEVLGISSGLPTATNVWPADLFRYTTNLVRTFTINGDDAYFSPDGTNLIARYNTDTNGDFGDWWSSTGAYWAPPGVTHQPQVQDAFGDPDTYQDLGVSELTILDVVGYTLASKATVAPNTAPVLTIVHSGLNQFTVSWTNTAIGYVLEENTNLSSAASWSLSLSGTLNPAIIVSTAASKFYRLYQPPIIHGAQPKAVALTLAKSPVELTVHRIRPRHP